MRFCYVDESGTDGKSPYVVFAGLVFDGTKRAKVTRESRALVDTVRSHARRPVTELKGNRLYLGEDAWWGVDDRWKLIESLLDWFVDQSGGYLALAAVGTENHKSSDLYELSGLDLWTAGALHIALQIQKTGKSKKNNKGQSVLVFDQQVMRQEALTELLINPPDFTDDYYDRPAKADPFDQVIDTPLFAASHHLPLIQVADVFGYIIRQHIEVSTGHRGERYKCEAEILADWYERLSPRMLDLAARWPKRTKSALAAAYRKSAPDCLAA